MNEVEVVVMGMRGGVASEALVAPKKGMAALGQKGLPIGPGYHEGLIAEEPGVVLNYGDDKTGQAGGDRGD